MRDNMPLEEEGMKGRTENVLMVKGLLIGILSGAAIGIAIGMLYAPHSGKITRSLISEKVNQARHDTGKVIGQARNRAQNAVKTARSKIAG